MAAPTPASDYRFRRRGHFPSGAAGTDPARLAPAGFSFGHDDTPTMTRPARGGLLRRLRPLRRPDPRPMPRPLRFLPRQTWRHAVVVLMLAGARARPLHPRHLQERPPGAPIATAAGCPCAAIGRAVFRTLVASDTALSPHQEQGCRTPRHARRVTRLQDKPPPARCSWRPSIRPGHSMSPPPGPRGRGSARSRRRRCTACRWSPCGIRRR